MVGRYERGKSRLVVLTIHEGTAYIANGSLGLLFLVLTLDLDQLVLLVLQELDWQLNLILSIVVVLFFIIGIMERFIVVNPSWREFFDVCVILSNLDTIILNQLHFDPLATPRDDGLFFFDLKGGRLRHIIVLIHSMITALFLTLGCRLMHLIYKYYG